MFRSSMESLSPAFRALVPSPLEDASRVPALLFAYPHSLSAFLYSLRARFHLSLSGSFRVPPHYAIFSPLCCMAAARLWFSPFPMGRATTLLDDAIAHTLAQTYFATCCHSCIPAPIDDDIRTIFTLSCFLYFTLLAPSLTRPLLSVLDYSPFPAVSAICAGRHTYHLATQVLWATHYVTFVPCFPVLPSSR
jgi:hypothetical protein